MNFKDQMQRDLSSVFMNTEEFADFFTINGCAIKAVEDGEDLIRRIQTDYGGMAIGDLMLHVPETEWAKVPKVSNPPHQGDAVTVGKMPAIVFSCARNQGMLDIIFQYKRK